MPLGENVPIRVFSALYFPVLRLDTEIYRVISLNTGKYEPGKIRI